MNMVKFWLNSFLVCSLCCLFSCQAEKGWEVLDVDVSSKELTVEDVFYTFNDMIPIGLTLQDSVILVNLARSPQSLIALDLRSKVIINSFGDIGQGPDELISPQFAARTKWDSIVVFDINKKQIMGIAYEGKSGEYVLTDIRSFPEIIYPTSDMAVSSNFVTGRNLEKEDAMFFIFNKQSEKIKNIPFYPVIKGLDSRPNYFYAVRTAINERTKKVIAANYFFNLIHIYTLKGEHIRSLAFSDNPIPAVLTKTKEINLEAPYTGAQAIFPSDDYCYVMSKTKNSEAKHAVMLTQIDWEGKLIQSFHIKEDIIGGFYVDEEMKKIYAIVQDLDEDGQEIQKIVSYRLD